MIRFSIIIPIFNEYESIFKLLNEISEEFKKKLPEIIVVDDGSTDQFHQTIRLERLQKPLLVKSAQLN